MKSILFSLFPCKYDSLPDQILSHDQSLFLKQFVVFSIELIIASLFYLYSLYWLYSYIYLFFNSFQKICKIHPYAIFLIIQFSYSISVFFIISLVLIILESFLFVLCKMIALWICYIAVRLNFPYRHLKTSLPLSYIWSPVCWIPLFSLLIASLQGMYESHFSLLECFCMLSACFIILLVGKFV